MTAVQPRSVYKEMKSFCGDPMQVHQKEQDSEMVSAKDRRMFTSLRETGAIAQL